MKKPNPGSPEAIAAGCTCPVMDNAHGSGFRGMPGVFVFTGGCTLHQLGHDQTAPPPPPETMRERNKRLTQKLNKGTQPRPRF